MSDMIIKNTNIVFPNKILPNHSVFVTGGIIDDIISDELLPKTIFQEAVDGAGGFLAPGFIDLHFHGLHNFLIDNGPNDLAEICRILPRYGVTSFLPTVCPRPKGQDSNFLKSLVKTSVQGAQILGFHLEGPFLCMTGALPPEALGKADTERVKALIDAAKPLPAIFSISPEFENITDLIRIMSENNVPVFITHTKANVEQTQEAIEAGARHATHFYDVFPCPGETEPGSRPCGTVEAIFADPRVSVDFILDGEHVDPVAVKMALQCKGNEKVCLITDANIGSGLSPGKYKFGKEEVEFKYLGGPARMTKNSSMPGALAGSGLTMNSVLKNALKMLQIDLPLAVRMASTNPAAVLNQQDHKGQIAKGYDADIVLLDKEMNVTRTWISGLCVYDRKTQNTGENK